jgi:hypothetical protein
MHSFKGLQRIIQSHADKIELAALRAIQRREIVDKIESIRVCREHLYPVGLTQDRPEFVCLLKYERLEIKGTRLLETNNELLPNMVTARGDAIKRLKQGRLKKRD